MAKMKNFMMDVEDHVNAYFPFYGGDEEFIIDEVVAEVEKNLVQWAATMLRNILNHD